MIEATVYYTETGKIVFSCQVPDTETVEANLQPGMDYIFGTYDPERYVIQNGSAVEKADYGKIPLEVVKAEARFTVRGEIKRARAHYITYLPGQDMIYQAKEAEAKIYLATDPQPSDLTDFPLLTAETGITVPTTYELAQMWLNMAHQWRTVAANLEGLRMKANNTIANATTQTEIDTALNDFHTQLNAQGF